VNKICTTQKHVQRNKELYPEVCDEILKNTYVDDFAFCRDEVNEARELQQSAKELMAPQAAQSYPVLLIYYVISLYK
jgi:hypothetical protein